MGNASCKSALQRTLQQQSEASYVSFGLLVFCFVITGIGFGARLVQVGTFVLPQYCCLYRHVSGCASAGTSAWTYGQSTACSVGCPSQAVCLRVSRGLRKHCILRNTPEQLRCKVLARTRRTFPLRRQLNPTCSTTASLPFTSCPTRRSSSASAPLKSWCVIRASARSRNVSLVF